MTQEALKLALESMKRIDAWLIQRGYTGLMPQEKETITAIEKALAQPEQLQEENERLHVENRRLIDRIETIGVPVVVCCQQYDTCLKPCTPRGRHLVQRTWVGLTNNELQPIADGYRILFGSWVEDFARAIEAKLKDKNEAL